MKVEITIHPYDTYESFTVSEDVANLAAAYAFYGATTALFNDRPEQPANAALPALVPEPALLPSDPAPEITIAKTPKPRGKSIAAPDNLPYMEAFTIIEAKQGVVEAPTVAPPVAPVAAIAPQPLATPQAPIPPVAPSPVGGPEVTPAPFPSPASTPAPLAAPGSAPTPIPAPTPMAIAPAPLAAPGPTAGLAPTPQPVAAPAPLAPQPSPEPVDTAHQNWIEGVEQLVAGALKVNPEQAENIHQAVATRINEAGFTSMTEVPVENMPALRDAIATSLGYS